MEARPLPILDPQVAAAAPPRFHLLAKPSGSTCNIDCKYCFFLSKEALYPNEKHRMSPATLEVYIRQLLESHRDPEVTVAWQGGEPTLMGVDFFRRSMELVERYRRPGQRVLHTFQTNGIALDDEWCAFLKEHEVLVGLSVDGPRDIHDRHRVTRGGKGTFSLVMKGWQHLKKHGVEFNILCTVNVADRAPGAPRLPVLPRRARGDVDAVHSHRGTGHAGDAEAGRPRAGGSGRRRSDCFTRRRARSSPSGPSAGSSTGGS